MERAILKDPQVIEHMQRLNAIWASFDAKVEKMQADLNALQDVFSGEPNYSRGISKRVMK
jgi:hypothetical protein